MIKAGYKSVITKQKNIIAELRRIIANMQSFTRNSKNVTITTGKRSKSVSYDINKIKIDTRCESGDSKEEMRNRVMVEIKKSAKKYGITDGLIATLSGFHLRMEKKIHKFLPKFIFQTFETDTDKFKALKKKLKTNRWRKSFLKPSPENIFNFINTAKPNSIAHLLADWCDAFQGGAEPLRNAMSRNIVKKGGLIWTTFDTRGKAGTPQLLELLVSEFNGRYIIVSHFPPYHRRVNKLNEGSAVMYSLIIRRVK